MVDHPKAGRETAQHVLVGRIGQIDGVHPTGVVGSQAVGHVRGERRLARARRSGDRDELVGGQPRGDRFQVSIAAHHGHQRLAGTHRPGRARTAAAPPELQVRVLGQDRVLQQPQLPPHVEPLVLAQLGTHLGQHRQGPVLVTLAVAGQGELADEPFAVGELLGGFAELIQVGDRGFPVHLQPEARLERGAPLVLDPAHHRNRPRFGGQIAEQRLGRQRQGLVQQPDRGFGVVLSGGGARSGDRRFEAQQVQFVGVDPQRVPRRGVDDVAARVAAGPARFEQVPQCRDVGLQRGTGGARRVVAPQRRHQVRLRSRSRRLRREDGQQRAHPGRPQDARVGRIGMNDGDSAEQSHLHAGSLVRTIQAIPVGLE